MKVLFVGESTPFGRTSQRLRALKDLGHEVRAQASASHEQNRFADFVSRVSIKVRMPVDWLGINRTILSAAEEFRPDVLWIEKGNLVRPRTLQGIRNRLPETRIASYSEDDMFARHNRSRFYTRGLKYYDVVFTTKTFNCDPEELPRLGAHRVVFVNKAHDRYLHRPVPVSERDREVWGSGVGFVGSFEQERAESMLFLAENGIEVRVWGNGWQAWRGRHSDLRIEDRPAYGEDYVRVLCATKINLCFLRKLNRDLQTARSMEIPACGGFMLAERTQEHFRLFEGGREAAFFASDEELLDKVRYYLERDEDREAVGAAGRSRCLRSGYTHHDRLEYMLSCLGPGM